MGLPDGIMGNSEVGHLNIGAGRVVYQDLMRIDLAIEDGSFFTNPVIVASIQNALDNQKALHLMGLVSDGGVHSQLTHLLALLDMAGHRQLEQIVVHAILDGRDTPPTKGVKYLSTLQSHMEASGSGAIASICGRFYAMDRDNRLDRTQLAYQAIANAIGPSSNDPLKTVEENYKKNITDEFILPTVMKNFSGIKNNDGLLMANFRPDRVRQILEALLFNKPLKFCTTLGLIEYSEKEDS